MHKAISIYKGGSLLPAEEADYNTSKEMGMICPFCKSAVFLVREHRRNETTVRPAWKHYKSAKNIYCENKALSKEGKALLKQFSKQSQGQRLALFNKRFWDLMSFDKVIPPLKSIENLISADEINRIIQLCHDKWNPAKIIQEVPTVIKISEDKIINHQALNNLTIAEKEMIIKHFSDMEISPLRFKILSEVIEWLKTKSASKSFKNLIYLALLEIADFKIKHSTIEMVFVCAVSLLIFTDWEEAIKSLENPTKGIGFVPIAQR